MNQLRNWLVIDYFKQKGNNNNNNKNIDFSNQHKRSKKKTLMNDLPVQKGIEGPRARV